MAKVTPIQSTFSGGEFSPLMWGHVENERYKTGLETCLNYIPTIQGSAVRRPGTKNLCEVKDSAHPPVLIPFQFSATQAYMLEFGDLYIRFYADNGQMVTTGTSFQVSGFTTQGGLSGFFPYTATRADIKPHILQTVNGSVSITPGSALELVSPYAIADVAQIRWAQTADTIYLVHPNYPVYKLQRLAQTYWDLKQVYLPDGPCLPLNSYRVKGDSVGTKLTLAFVAGLNATVTTGPSLVVSTCASLGGEVNVTTTTDHGYSSGQAVFIKSVVGTTEANSSGVSGTSSPPNYWTITVNTSTTFSLRGSVFVHAYVSGGAVFPALFTDNAIGFGLANDNGRVISLLSGTVRMYGTIVNFNDPHFVSIAVDANSPLLAPGVCDWKLGIYGVTGGYPSAVRFHQNRMFLTGASSVPQEIDGSSSADYENFSISNPLNQNVVDSNALQYNLVSQDVNTLRWLSGNSQGLLAGSYNAEWSVTPTNTNAALTPTNVNAQQTSFYGTANVDAVQAGNSTIYVQRAQRKVREMNYFFQVGTFRSTDLTELAEHVSLPTITKLAVQKETWPLIWALRSDGQLASMSYNRDDTSLKAGWARHTLGGQSDVSGTPPIVKSMAVIPDPTTSFDQLWLVVQRWINGASVVSIEYMTKPYDDNFLQEDSYHLDNGVTAPTAAGDKAITGISINNPAAITSLAHGFSNGDTVKITGVVGVGISTTDINGVVTLTSLVNNQIFLVASATTNNFVLHDFASNNISSIGYGVWISGGSIRKLNTTFSGFTWLKNETVSVLADGAIHPDVVVSNSGVITTSFAAAKIQVGYKYNSDLKLLRQEGGSQQGSSIGKTRRTSRAAILCHNVGDLSIGTSFGATRLLPCTLSQADQNHAGTAVPLFSGIIREGVESQYDFESQLCIRQNSPLPGSIQAVTVVMESIDV